MVGGLLLVARAEDVLQSKLELACVVRSVTRPGDLREAGAGVGKSAGLAEVGGVGQVEGLGSELEKTRFGHMEGFLHANVFTVKGGTVCLSGFGAKARRNLCSPVWSPK